MLDPAGLSANPAPAHPPAPSGLAICIANTWIMLEDESHDEDDEGWNDTFDYAAHPDALDPFAEQVFVYPAEGSGDEEFAALVAFVEEVKAPNTWSA
ncbi:MAG: hypothetical protein RR311_10110 [Comamonas sp.]